MGWRIAARTAATFLTGSWGNCLQAPAFALVLPRSGRTVITGVLFVGDMLNAVRSHLAYRASVRSEAQMLIDLYGGESWEISRERAFLAMREGTDPDRTWHVIGIIERRLKICHQPDTATRYLENAKARGQHPFLW